MKKIFTLFVLLNVIAMGTASAQMSCYVNYTMDTIPYNPQPYGVGTLVPFIGTDTFSAVIPIGFNFNFYGKNYSSLIISPNGCISFDTSQAIQQDGWNPSAWIPSNYILNNSILLCYQFTFQGEGAYVRYNLSGISPNRKFIISYDTTHIENVYIQDTTFFTGQMILYETSNIIEMHIFHEPEGFWVDNVGLQSLDSSVGIGENNLNGYDTTGRRFAPFNAPEPPLSICIVTVDSASGKNMIVWNQPVGVPVDSFIIYKETSQANVYAPIGTQFNNVFSTFIDTGSYPAVVSNTYRLGFRDSCGIISDTSGAHTTIHLSISQGIGTSWNLSWNAYTGFSYPSFNIYRGTSPSTMTLLTTLNSNVFAYTDLTPPSTVYYAIEIVDSAGCNPSARMENNYSSSMSNIVNPNNTGIYELHALQHISIYPNPATNILTVRSQLSILNSQLIIIDVLGNKIYQQNISGIDNSIDVSNWSEGVYFYEIISNNNISRGKFIVQK